jgi:hypothetical protein
MRAFLPLLALFGLACVESGVTVHNSLPEVVITAPLLGAEFLEQEVITLQAYVHDAETANEHLLYLWGLDPEGNLDGTQTIDENGVTLVLDQGLAHGDWTVMLTVVDPRGGAIETTTLVHVRENEAPAVSLLAPTQDEWIYEEDSVEVVLLVTDDEDPADLFLTWTCSDDRLLGEAPEHPDSDGEARFYMVDVTPGDVQLAVTATDRLGATDSSTVLFYVFTGDVDEDGWVDVAYGGEDCDDDNDTVYPGAPEIEDGLDNDCDGLMDNTGEWHTTVLDSSGEAGHQLALVLNGDEEPLLGWVESNGDLTLAYLGMIGWAKETLATGDISSLAMAWQDDLYVLWTDEQDWSLNLGVHDGTTLETTIIDDDLETTGLAYQAAGHGTFVLDDDAIAHAAWVDGQAQAVTYGWGDSSGFNSETASDRVSGALAIALDPVGGGVGLAIYDSDAEELLFAYRDLEGAWTSSIVDDEGEPGYAVQMVFDSGGTPHLLWWDDDNNRVRYGWWSGLAWIVSDLATSNETSDLYSIRGLELLVDENDMLHAAWAWSFPQSADITLYEAGYALEEGDWQVTDLTADGDNPTDLAMAIDGLSEPHLAWRDGETKNVVYRYRY